VVFVPLATLSPEVVIHERFFCGRPVEPFRDSKIAGYCRPLVARRAD